MCGIVGILHFAADDSVDPADVEAMTRALIHRGPDADGFHLQPEVGIGARRLRIIDLETGDQPIANEDGSVCAALNGEIYNYLELRAELIERGHSFRSVCDTEVIAHLYEEDGIDLVRRLRGMFALAVWDERNGQLMVARDRFGIKPLFIADRGGRMAFASEIKALLRLPWVDRAWAPEALDAYLHVGYVPGPMTAYRGVRKLEPGTAEIWCRGGTGRAGGRIRTQQYWKPCLATAEPAPSFADAQERAAELLKESIALHLRSDVPLGAFLSGGVDSSIIVALMRAGGVQDLKTFSIGFENDSASELPYAERVARHIGTDHYTEIISAAEVHRLPEILARFDEPFADNSAIPTYFVSRLARQEVTVSLTGDGGDELFAGYPLYASLPSYRMFDRLPVALRGQLSRVASRAFPEGIRGGGFARRLASPKELRFFGLRYGQAQTEGFVTNALSPRFAAFVREAGGGAWRRRFETDGSTTDALRVDQTTYLLDNGLTKVDRSSMAVSLETRVPLLDHVFADYVNSLPLSYKIRFGHQKILLKAIGQPYLPEGLFDRPKQGFSIPMLMWLRGPLWDFATDRLLGDELGLFDPAGVRALLDLLQRGERASSRVWTLLSLATWADTARTGAPW